MIYLEVVYVNDKLRGEKEEDKNRNTWKTMWEGAHKGVYKLEVPLIKGIRKDLMIHTKLSKWNYRWNNHVTCFPN